MASPRAGRHTLLRWANRGWTGPVERIILLGSVVGLDIRIRAYPGPDPAIDAGQLALLGRSKARLPTAVGMSTEVPLADRW